MKFTELGLSQDILSAVVKAGYETPTPIQEQTIMLALDGKDVIGQAQTGTGKTAAFGLPTLDKINVNGGLQALVIAPTRELAVQSQEELFRFGRDKGIKVRSVYGGASIEKQINALKSGAHVVVGTPGRMVDLIKRRALKLGDIETLILDEADEMLNMGFIDDLEFIIKATPAERQTLLFSATMPDPIKKIGVKFMKNPEHIKIVSKEMTSDLIDQYYIKTKEFEKFDVLTRLIDVQHPELAIIFGRTKRRVDEITRGLKLLGYRAEGIHGDLAQQKRLAVLRDFKNDNLDILIATDVAARGLDISGVTHVYNYDITQDQESYVHRIGRTGRAGKSGLSITFVSNNEMGYLRAIERLTKKEMKGMKPPTREEAYQASLAVAFDEIKRDLTDEKLAKKLVKFDADAERLLAEYDAKLLVSLLLQAKVNDPDTRPKVDIAAEKPLPFNGEGGGRGGNRGGGRGGNNRGGRDRRGGFNRDKRGGRDRDDRNKKDYYKKDKQKVHPKATEKKPGFVIRNKGDK
ncbi:DEAD-box ATP-dependent RNA helicase CshA [Lactococcus hodotermopsidis]|uniref:DEAD-box ATP-dependent RNA helicase CshA n=1 Tax=Pseudolactococcus hodotermopsidis TaxID=2709157 RepID=A0A6A0BEK4_9LACT|nr:DEAD/DEAH box helicase [Lactococcus hodotermopsidis]GFH43125.1 DEAD-box ATP-dependent RNA helicase CshA [Lactococcus hodotermopsidis]